MASVDAPIIGKMWSKGFCSRGASRPPHVILASFLVHLTNQTHIRPYQRINTNFKSASMLTILYSIHQIHPRRSSSRVYSKNTSKLTSWEMSTIFKGLHLIGSRTKTATFPFIYASHHSQNSQTIGSQFKVQTRFPIWHHISLASLLIPFLQLIPSILIFLVENNSIREFLAASIGLQLVLVLKLHLLSHSLPHTAILHTQNTIRPQFMLSNISQAPMNTVYHSTPNPWPQSKNLIISPITMIEKPI